MYGKENINTENNGKNAIKGLKKINRIMNILKVIIVLLVIFIITVYGIYYIGEKKEDENGEYIYSIIVKSYSKMEEIQKENYLLVEDFYVCDNNGELTPQKRVTFHKDKYFKEEIHYNNNSLKYTNYGIEDNSDLYFIQLINNHVGCGGCITEGKDRKNPLYYDIRVGSEYYRKWNIKEEKYNNKEYYVISKNDYEIWIDKNNMLINKILYYKSNEHTFKWEIGTVTDEDVRIKSLDGYEIDDINKKFIDDYKILKK